MQESTIRCATRQSRCAGSHFRNRLRAFVGRYALRGRDPAVADENLYRYCEDAPTEAIDPSGLADGDASPLPQPDPEWLTPVPVTPVGPQAYYIPEWMRLHLRYPVSEPVPLMSEYALARTEKSREADVNGHWSLLWDIHLEAAAKKPLIVIQQIKNRVVIEDKAHHWHETITNHYYEVVGFIEPNSATMIPGSLANYQAIAAASKKTVVFPHAKLNLTMEVSDSWGFSGTKDDTCGSATQTGVLKVYELTPAFLRRNPQVKREPKIAGNHTFELNPGPEGASGFATIGGPLPPPLWQGSASLNAEWDYGKRTRIGKPTIGD